MATSHAAPATSTAAAGNSKTSNTAETIVGWYMFRIDGFSAKKDIGVGNSNKSDAFRVGGHEWYIECFPCGHDEKSAGSVTISLCKQDDHPAAHTDCEFTLMESLEDGSFKEADGCRNRWVCFKEEPARIEFIKRERLESLLKDDCFQVRCLVLIEKFPSVAQPDLAAETISGSHILTVNGFNKNRLEIAVGESISSICHCVGGHHWYIDFYPCGENKNDKDGITTYLCIEDLDDEVKVRFEMTLLTHAGQKISSILDFYTFSERDGKYLCKFLHGIENESSSLLQNGIRIRCDMAIVKGILVAQPPPILGTDVTFEISGELFSAHKCVLATRSTAFMAEFFGPGKDSAGDTQVLRVDDMEPRVFKALLHFIYTHALPEFVMEDKVVMTRSLLVAADRYSMERLKLICADMLCSYIDATTAVTTLELADKHGCVKLKEACMKVIRDWLAKVTP